MINIGGTVSQRTRPPNLVQNDVKLNSGTFHHNQRRMTSNARVKKEIILPEDKAEPKRYPTSSESNLAKAFNAAQFRALSPAQLHR